MDKEYLLKKRLEVLENINPICKAFNIKDYDYIVDDKGREQLRIEDTYIGCSCNSISATIEELVGYIFVVYWKYRTLPFKTQTFNAIKSYWII